jgi:hypothetical protein
LGFLNKLLENLGGGDSLPCPRCGGALDNEALVEGSWWCDSCGSLFREQGDELEYLPPGYLDGEKGTHGRVCEACQRTLNDGDHYLPYEDGSNPDAYIRCRCGHVNILYGFGGDSD